MLYTNVPFAPPLLLRFYDRRGAERDFLYRVGSNVSLLYLLVNSGVIGLE
jgi:hypothetical protein